MALRFACLALSALSFVQGSAVLNKRDALNSCLAAAKVPHDVKGSSQWNADIEPYNLRLNYTPAAVAVPTCTSQVKAAVSCGVNHGVRVSAKGGGHSYASYGYGGEDGHLVIILSNLFGVSLVDGKAFVQPGTRLGHLATEIYDQGKRAIAHGSCPGVGVAGHALHGGYGLASRTHGLTLDFLIGARVVLANATEVHCSATEHPDLFWALRGAGSSFGIVTQYEFSTFSAPTVATPFSINLNWDANEAISGLKAFQELAMNAPKELNFQIYMAPGGQTIQGVYYGSISALNAALKPLTDKIGIPVATSSTMGWIQSLENAANGVPLDQTEPYDAHNTFYTTSLMTKALTDQQISDLVNALFANINDPNGRHSWYLLFDCFGGQHSQATAISPSATAFVHRDKLFLFQFSDSVSSGPYPPEGFTLLKGFRTSVTKTMANGSWGMYANYIDSQLSDAVADPLYWGTNLPRLRRIKKDVDPQDVFWNPQGVRPA